MVEDSSPLVVPVLVDPVAGTNPRVDNLKPDRRGWRDERRNREVRPSVKLGRRGDGRTTWGLGSWPSLSLLRSNAVVGKSSSLLMRMANAFRRIILGE